MAGATKNARRQTTHQHGETHTRQLDEIEEGLGNAVVAVGSGLKAELRTRTDSNAATAMASGRGVGMMRHIELRYLWVQDMHHFVKCENQEGAWRVHFGGSFEEMEGLASDCVVDSKIPEEADDRGASKRAP